MPECVNLLKLFGDEYQIEFDPAYDPTNRPRKSLDPWYMVTPGKYGTIYPAGGNLLRVDIDHHRRIAGRVRRLAFAKLVQDGDQEKTLEFPVSEFESVATIVRSRRRRQLQPQDKERLLARGQQYRFRKRQRTGATDPV